MTNKEKEILDIIKANPLIEQEGIAKKLNIKRSTVAVHIASLQKQGYLLGKGYVINDEEYVVGIGAANVDIYGKSNIDIQKHYDHPANIHTGVGGVTRNILENISLLGGKTKLLCALGNDVYGQMVIDKSSKAGIDMSNVIKIDNESTGLFMQVQDKDNDMYLALCDMSVNKHINIDYLKDKASVINKAKAIIIDPSLDNKVIEYVLDNYSDKIPIFLDPLSDNYALKIKPYINRIFCLKPNRSELSKVSGVKIESDDDLIKSCKLIINKGVKHLFVSLGRYGSLYMDEHYNVIRKKKKPVKNMVNASGAGDSFMAVVVYGYLNGLDIEKTIEYANAAGTATIMHENPINPELSFTLLDKIIKGE